MLPKISLSDLCNELNIDFSITILVLQVTHAWVAQNQVAVEKFDADFIA